MKLIIAEKPSVARAIAPVVGANKKNNSYMEGNGYIISWCFGHLVRLVFPNDYCSEWASTPWTFSQLPMLPEQWKFQVTKDCKEQFNILKTLLNDSSVDEVICATDADREGECIFRYVYNLSKSCKPVKRLWVSSLEEKSIIDGLAKLKNGVEYDNIYNAGFSRAKADWLVGMNGSRLFSIRYRSSLNIGRVQTPTLAMIVKRDYDVKNFVKQKFFTVDLNLGEFKAYSDRIDDENKANEIVSVCNGKTAVVAEVKKEVKTLNPPKLFDLTSLQREANKKFGYTAQQTLDYLQNLYEGKLATYPRTDSQYITTDMEQTAIDVINAVNSVFGLAVVGQSDTKRIVNDKKVTGHHAILPTVNIADTNLDELPEGQRNILKIIALRLVCAVSEPHKYQSVKAEITCENNSFSASGKLILQNGWKSIDEKIKAKDEDTTLSQVETKLPELTEGQTFNNVTAEKSEHFTAPPKPYTEDTLLSAMEHAGQEDYDEETEKKGLGTPATRAATIEGLAQHGYIERKGKKISATEKGRQLIEVVPEEVKSPKLTADWEMKLQQIEHGQYSADSFMTEIEQFVKNICSTYGIEDSSGKFASPNAPLGKCPKCGAEVKKGKFGFYCTGKCGMNVAKVYGKELTETQLKNLLNGKEISYTANGNRKTIVVPKVAENNYQGKTYFQWATKKG